MLHEEFLPEYHFSERHQITISASPSTIHSVVDKLDVSSSRIIRLLLFLRGIPRSTSNGIEGWKKMGFIILEQQPDKEVILGLVGQFWKANGEIQSVQPEDFRSFNNPQFAKATWNFEIIPQSGNQIILETQTRIFCPDESVRKRFKRYWFLIQPFSGLIRMEMLKIIKRESERLHQKVTR